MHLTISQRHLMGELMRYRFDQFELDTLTQSLSHEGKLLNCDERIVRLLLLLIEHAPEHVDKQTLLNSLWPDTVVSDWSISRLISDARKLFKSVGADFAIIQTLHGRGYRLSAEVLTMLQQEQPASPEPSAQTEPSVETEPTVADRQTRTTRPLRLIASLSVILLLLSATLYFWLDNSKPLQISEPADTRARVLWVDDHPENNQVERKFLENQGVAVYNTRSTQDALILLSMYQYDVVISDMGRQSDPLAGLKLVETMRRHGHETPFLMYTILPSEAQQQLLKDYGAQGVAVDDEELYQLLAAYLPIETDSN